MAADQESNPGAIDVWNSIHIDQHLADPGLQDVFDFFTKEKAIAAPHELPIQLHHTNITNNLQSKFQSSYLLNNGNPEFFIQLISQRANQILLERVS